MAEYQSLPELRGELTEDDPDRRASAYQAVMEAGLKVSDVLSDDPPTEELVEAGVVPESGQQRPAAAEDRERIISLLEDIKENTDAA